jgi:hypothetical protein
MQRFRLGEYDIQLVNKFPSLCVAEKCIQMVLAALSKLSQFNPVHILLKDIFY